jgi:type I restriction enzyme, S subunit
MHKVRVSPKLLGCERFDPDYYHPQHLEDEKKLKAIGCAHLGKVGKFFAGPFGSELPSSLYLNEGIPLFRVGNVGQMQVSLENIAYLAPEVHAKLSASEVVPGDLLIVKASVGEKICKIPDYINRANITQHIIGIHPSNNFDIDYVAAFLFCCYGRRQLVRRSLGSIIQYLGINDARTVLLPLISTTAQKYIGNKVRQTEQLREKVQNLQYQISCLLSEFNPRQLSKRKIQRMIPDKLLNSLNSNAYMPKFLEAEQIITSQSNASLLELCTSIADGPFGSNLKVDDYKVGSNARHPVIRVQDCLNGELSRDDLVWIDSNKQKQLSRSEVLAGDLLITKAGRIGSASVYPDDLPSGNITSHLVRVRLKPGIDPNYVAEFLETTVGRAVTERHSFKSTRPELTKAEIESCFIALIDKTLMSQVGSLARLKNACSRFSVLMTASAKFLVEALIEGQITETEMREAQESLERGDLDADREILSRLTTKGYGADAPPLFPDLDKLYQAINQDTTQGVKDNE